MSRGTEVKMIFMDKKCAGAPLDNIDGVVVMMLLVIMY